MLSKYDYHLLHYGSPLHSGISGAVCFHLELNKVSSVPFLVGFAPWPVSFCSDLRGHLSRYCCTHWGSTGIKMEKRPCAQKHMCDLISYYQNDKSQEKDSESWVLASLIPEIHTGVNYHLLSIRLSFSIDWGICASGKWHGLTHPCHLVSIMELSI